MKVCVFGLWHLGSVVAACLAASGHEVVGLDFDEAVVKGLQSGVPPLFEPGLEELVKEGLEKRTLSFTTNATEALSGAEVVWVTYDTPVDDNDVADVEFVFSRIKKLFPLLEKGTLVLISSQLPVGTTRRLEQVCTADHPDKRISFACSPENLRLGKAISVFNDPDRVVVGLRLNSSSAAGEKERICQLLKSLSSRIEWMSTESAEMTKHAVNSFLATSVTFINEIATLCEQVGADAREVQRGLKTEARIGPKAYLNPGAAFAGGTLARDLDFLERLGAEHRVHTDLLSAARISNQNHRQWTQRKLVEVFQSIRNKTIAIWGLTYKPGTDTLRRSDSVALCRWLTAQGASVRAHDPAIKTLPEELKQEFALCATSMAAIENADALVLATAWPEFLDIAGDAIVQAMPKPLVIDPNRFLEQTLGVDPRIQYVAVGKAVV
ncbi:MAG: UDP-glucose dehydrogenase family protein [Pyrinomonadaceae bacterium]